MNKNTTPEVARTFALEERARSAPLRSLAMLAALGMLVLTAITGCQTSQGNSARQPVPPKSEPIVLREGDVLRITFPGAPSLDSTQPIRRDGKIVLSLVGEVTAAGVTPADLEKQVIKLYASQLVSKQVTVTLVSSSIPVFVTGAVLRPGKIQSDHPLTAFEAIMEAGGFDYAKANLATVTVIRFENGRTRNYTLNYKRLLEGKPSEPFYLKPSDVVYVPERFSWY